MNTPPLSPKLTMTQIAALMYDQHANYLDDPVMNFLSPSFEDIADLILLAEKNQKDAQIEAAYLEQQQERRRYPERLELDARYGVMA